MIGPTSYLPIAAGGHRLRASDLQQQLSVALRAAERLLAEPGTMAIEVAPLAARLRQIQEELDRLRTLQGQPVPGELYPFWVQMAQQVRR